MSPAATPGIYRCNECNEFFDTMPVGPQHVCAGSTPETKMTNPKDVIGSRKLHLSLVPDTLIVEAATAYVEGASKYGRFNWRIAGVRASIYIDALERHMAKYKNGEDYDPATRVKHLASVLACAGILLDAELCGKLTDDRPPRAPIGRLIEQNEEISTYVKELFKDKTPYQYTIADGEASL